ncbi:hypothetical protein KDI_39160 [Dictyobacter arantiisoli]|uniref:Uncharacterized protein n=1 Tax=Dictyobacter arantiisoli TaxID=2014874 RepID=A0A5A5TG80_9CHLR|nr:hypothetical protein KDI_39160 [Dictyobacter arantiisoli]
MLLFFVVFVIYNKILSSVSKLKKLKILPRKKEPEKRLEDIVNLFVGMGIIAELERGNRLQSSERYGIASS